MARESKTWKKLADTSLDLVSLALVVIAWEIVSRKVNSLLLPGPVAVAKVFYEFAVYGDLEGYPLLRHIYASVIRISAGFGAATLMAIPLGIAMGLYPSLYDRTKGIIEPIRFISPLAWIPFAIVLLSGFSRFVFLIWIGAFFPIWINVMVAVPQIDPVYINVARTLGASQGFIIRKIVVPAIVPDMLSGLRIGLGIGWMCIVAAEMIGGELVGLGNIILKYTDIYGVAEIICGMLTIGIIGFGLNEILVRLNNYLLRWR